MLFYSYWFLSNCKAAIALGEKQTMGHWTLFWGGKTSDSKANANTEVLIKIQSRLIWAN